MRGDKDANERDDDTREPEFHVELNFGDLFRGLGGFLDLINQLDREGKGEVTRTGRIKRGKMNAIYGFSIRTGLGGKPVIDRFGNVGESEAGSVVEDIREPLTDVFDEADSVVVVMELPGVAEADISLELETGRLTVTAEGADQRYRKHVELPVAVDPSSLERTYNNGILELSFKKAT
jgi:HSP20 family protein